MDERPLVVLRNEGEIRLRCRGDAVGPASGLWDSVGGPTPDRAADERDPVDAARARLREETGIDDTALVRRGDPFTVTEGAARWRAIPFLFDCGHRDIELDGADAEWVQPPELLGRETVPWLWTGYDRVRPRVATVADDRTHGSAWLSLRALETLRDEAALAVAGRADERERAERDSDDWAGLAALARRLRSARPSMAVLANRLNRVMTAASDERTPAAVERAARGAVEQSVAADRDAARAVAERLPDRVATLSRSGTVETALGLADPEAVLVAESRPGNEGVGVAEELAAVADVTLTSDAALPFELTAWDAGAVLVGADRILPDGRVLNKAGTCGAARAAAAAGLDCLVVAASDKVAPTDSYDLEPRDPAELYDGDADLAVANPTFDVTPADAVTVVTEQGLLSTAEVRAVAESHAEWAEWD